MLIKTITLDLRYHRNQNNIFILFAQDWEVIPICRSIGAKWSQSKCGWYLPLNRDNYKKIKAAFGVGYKLEIEQFMQDAKKLPYSHQTKVDKFAVLTKREVPEVDAVLDLFLRKMRAARYAESTISTYYAMIKGFFYFIKKQPNEVTLSDVEEFSADWVYKNHYSRSYHRQALSALRILQQILPQSFLPSEKLVSPKRLQALPTVLSPEEILDLLRQIDNIKHRT